MTRLPIPLRPDPLAIRSAASRSFARAFVACAFAAIEGRRPDDAIEIAPKIWPEDRDVAALVKAAASPTTTGSASALVHTVLTDFLASLAPQSAAAELMARGLQLRFDGRGAISAPSIIAPAAKFVGEGQPIPVAQGQTARFWSRARLRSLSPSRIDEHQYAGPCRRIFSVILDDRARPKSVHVQTMPENRTSLFTREPRFARFDRGQEARECVNKRPVALVSFGRVADCQSSCSFALTLRFGVLFRNCRPISRYSR
jgi:hypothetical protein